MLFIICLDDVDNYDDVVFVHRNNFDLGLCCFGLYEILKFARVQVCSCRFHPF